MTAALNDQAYALIQGQRYAEALQVLERSLALAPDDGETWHLAGQCRRALDDLDGAIACHERAAELLAESPPIFLALGIALQLRERWQEAIRAFARAIEIDPDYELAYNSLALTQKKRGDLEKALHNFDAGAKALARRIVKSMRNERTNPILPHPATVGTLWVEHAGYAALYLASCAEGIDGIAFPTAELAAQESRTHAHEGLYWTDQSQVDGKRVRLYLPNYFNSFHSALRWVTRYSTLIGNRGTVFGMLGNPHEARLHQNETVEFDPETGAVRRPLPSGVWLYCHKH